jgi:signal transduction histidine kinase
MLSARPPTAFTLSPRLPFWRHGQRSVAAWLLALVAMFLLTGAETAQATEPVDRIAQRAFWEDTSAQANLESARSQTYTPFQGIFSRGYSDSAHWIRLTIAPSAQPLGLLITPAWLDEVTLYDPAQTGAPITVGDRHPLQNNALAGLGHSFQLPPSTEPREIWLRLQTTSSHLLSVKAIALAQVTQVSSWQIVWASLYAATLLLILLVLTAIWWVQRDRVLGAYVMRHAFYTWYGLAYLGIPALLFPGDLPPAVFDLAFSISAALIVPMAVWFDLAFLSGYRPQKHLLWLLKAIGVASVGVVFTLLAGHARLAMQLNALVLLAGTVVMMLTALSCKPDPSTERILSAKVMLAYYALIFSSLVIGLVNLLGWFQVREWSLYLLIQHGLVSGLMMTVMLIVRAQRMASQNQQTSWKLQKAQQDMALEQHRRQEQSQFLHMLMHELKTPLSVVSLALGTKNNREKNLDLASRAIQDMKAVIDRCVQAEQLGHANLAQHQQAVDVPATIRQLAQTTPLLLARLRLQAAPALPQPQTDPQLLQIVLHNLLDNAARYSHPHSPVVVTVQQTQQHGQAGLSVCVANTPGLAGWPDQVQVFSKFYRSKGAQRESGSGLGLYLAQQLSRSLGATLVHTPNNQHVEFVLWIPLSPA